MTNKGLKWQHYLLVALSTLGLLTSTFFPTVFTAFCGLDLRPYLQNLQKPTDETQTVPSPH
jgi:hypothetical protein